MLPPKLIKQWELPLFGFFTPGCTECSATSDLSSKKPLCNHASSPCGDDAGDCGNSVSGNFTVKEASSSNSHACSAKLHLLTLRQTRSPSDSSLAFACHFFQQQQPLLETAATDIEISSWPDIKLPLLSRSCVLRICDASQTESDAYLDHSIHESAESALQPIAPTNYVHVKQASRPSFQSYESKFRFLDSQIPPVVRPAVSCIFSAAIFAANVSTTNSQVPDNSGIHANSTAAVHPRSLSPARQSKVEKQGKGPNPASARVQQFKASEGPNADSSHHLPSSALSNPKIVSDIAPGDLSTFASCKHASVTPAADVSQKFPIVVSSSSENKNDLKKSPAYEHLKSKLWSKLHSKFRRETQPAVDVDVLKLVYNRCSSFSKCCDFLMTIFPACCVTGLR